MTDYYQVLGVNPEATPEEIRQRFRFLAKAYHPDRFSEHQNKIDAEEEMKRLNEAFEVLSNPEKRASYDNSRVIKDKKNEEHTTSEDSTGYDSAVTDYLIRIYEKWKFLHEKEPDVEDYHRVLDLLLGDLSSLLHIIYSDLNSQPAKVMLNDLLECVFMISKLGMALGAEIEKKEVPKQYKFGDLERFIVFPFFTKIANLRWLANSVNKNATNQVDQVINNLIDLSFDFFNVCVKEGASRAGHPERSFQNEKIINQEGHSHIDLSRGICQSCNRYVPIEKLSFHQNIGAIIIRFSRNMEGMLCAECAERYFWNYTGVTIFAGWWGALSCILTPIFLISNFWNYTKAWKLRSSSNRLHEIAIGGKMAVVGWLILVLWIGIRLNNPNQAASSSNTANPTNIVEQVRKPTVSNLPIPTPTQENPCVLWSRVSAIDEGKTMCVYGTALNGYVGGGTYYISFSKDVNAFRFLVLDGKYDGIKGSCVAASGEVKAYGQMPYIEIHQNLYYCE